MKRCRSVKKRPSRELEELMRIVLDKNGAGTGLLNFLFAKTAGAGLAALGCCLVPAEQRVKFTGVESMASHESQCIATANALRTRRTKSPDTQHRISNLQPALPRAVSAVEAG